MYHASLCKEFSQQWRIELEDRGHADDVARFHAWALRTTRPPNAEEARGMEAAYAQCTFPGKTSTGASSSAAK